MLIPKSGAPACECHGEPMLWYRDQRPGRLNGGRFACRVIDRARTRIREAEKRRTPAGKAASDLANLRYRNRPDIREKKRLQTAEWRRRNPERQREQGRIKRVRKSGANSDGHIRQDTWNLYGGACYLCGSELDPANWHEDHVTPLSRGGADTLENCRPACPPCNIRKGAKLPKMMVVGQFQTIQGLKLTHYPIGHVREVMA